MGANLTTALLRDGDRLAVCNRGGYAIEAETAGV
jgi:hypothetical protein